MNFELVLGDDMSLVEKSALHFVEGSHLVDNLTIKLGGKYGGAMARIECELPKGRAFVSENMIISGDIIYSVPQGITAYAGICYLQLVIVDGNKIIRSSKVSFSIEPSVYADRKYDEMQKGDFFSNAYGVIEESRRQTLDAKKVTNEATEAVGKMNNLNADISGRLARGELKGDKGDAGASPVIGEDKHWYINGVDTGVFAEGRDGMSVRLEPGLGTREDTAVSQNGITKEINNRFRVVKTFTGNTESMLLTMYDNVNLTIFVFATEYESDNYYIGIINKPRKSDGSAIGTITKLAGTKIDVRIEGTRIKVYNADQPINLKTKLLALTV